MANKRNGTIYAAVTSDLIQRICQHKQGLVHGFTKKYGCNQLVYYEQCKNMTSAIEREKQINAGSRKKTLQFEVNN